MEPQILFSIISCLAFSTVACFIPKRIKRYEQYTTAVFATALGLVVDMILAVKLKLYVLDKPGVQYTPLIAQIVLYFTSSIIVLNFFPFNKSILRKLAYVSGATALTLLFEAAAYMTGFIKYYKWSIGYSALCYPFLILLLVGHHRFFQWLSRRD